MKETADIIRMFKSKGIRVTPIRKAVVFILSKVRKPICVEDIGDRLSRLGLHPNKTTLYREMDFLVQGGWVTELDFGNGRKCYEWNGGHHHHLVCRKCNRIEELEAHEMESSFAEFEKSLSLKSGFSDLRHSLEFFGVCNQCRTA